MLTREKFKVAIQTLQKYEDYEQKLYDLDIDLANNEKLNSLIYQYVELLAAAMNDTNKWIDWWVWETQYGTNEEVNEYWNEGEDLKQPGHTVSSIDELYDLVTGGDN